jgi:hypothetical protein
MWIKLPWDADGTVSQWVPVVGVSRYTPLLLRVQRLLHKLRDHDAFPPRNMPSPLQRSGIFPRVSLSPTTRTVRLVQTLIIHAFIVIPLLPCLV